MAARSSWKEVSRHEQRARAATLSLARGGSCEFSQHYGQLPCSLPRALWPPVLRGERIRRCWAAERRTGTFPLKGEAAAPDLPSQLPLLSTEASLTFCDSPSQVIASLHPLPPSPPPCALALGPLPSSSPSSSSSSSSATLFLSLASGISGGECR